nr:hypothetical protein [uncultured Limnohabitans sp.]
MKLIILAFFIFNLTGCASIFSGYSQNVNLNVTCNGYSRPNRCVVSNTKGRWIFNTPETKNIWRDKSPLSVVCESGTFGGYGGVSDYEINPMVYGNILVGGLIGLTLDNYNDSLWAYPEKIVLKDPICGG